MRRLQVKSFQGYEWRGRERESKRERDRKGKEEVWTGSNKLIIGSFAPFALYWLAYRVRHHLWLLLLLTSELAATLLNLGKKESHNNNNN